MHPDLLGAHRRASPADPPSRLGAARGQGHERTGRAVAGGALRARVDTVDRLHCDFALRAWRGGV